LEALKNPALDNGFLARYMQWWFFPTYIEWSSPCWVSFGCETQGQLLLTTSMVERDSISFVEALYGSFLENLAKFPYLGVPINIGFFEFYLINIMVFRTFGTKYMSSINI
jgi:hypothetical protein